MTTIILFFKNYLPLIMLTAIILMAVKTFFLYKRFSFLEKLIQKISKENYYLINFLKHDVKSAAIAQKRALEIFPILEKDEQLIILEELSVSCGYSLDMIEMLLEMHSIENGESYDYNVFNFNDLARSVYEQAEGIFQANNVEVITGFDKIESIVAADKTMLKKAIKILMETAVKRADNTKLFEITTKNINNSVKFSINYSPKLNVVDEIETVLEENPRFESIGQGLKIMCCKKILDSYKSNLGAYSKNSDRVEIGFDLKLN